MQVPRVCAGIMPTGLLGSTCTLLVSTSHATGPPQATWTTIVSKQDYQVQICRLVPLYLHYTSHSVQQNIERATTEESPENKAKMELQSLSSLPWLWTQASIPDFVSQLRRKTFPPKLQDKTHNRKPEFKAKPTRSSQVLIACSVQTWELPNQTEVGPSKGTYFARILNYQ